MSSKLADISNQELAHMLRHQSQADIARELGVSRQAVSDRVRRHKIPDPYRWQTCRDSDIETIRELTAQGKTCREIGQVIGVSYSVVSVIRSKFGIRKPDRELPCPNCRTHHYARGLCGACYEYARKNNLLDKFPRQRHGKPGSDSKV